MSKYPISKLCPECGSAEYKARQPEEFIAFTNDRVCKACGTRYTPPTPAWAGVVFLLIGLLFTGLGGLALLAQFVGGAVNPVGLVCPGILALLGPLAIAHGLRSLSNPGKV